MIPAETSLFNSIQETHEVQNGKRTRVPESSNILRIRDTFKMFSFHLTYGSDSRVFLSVHYLVRL